MSTRKVWVVEMRNGNGKWTVADICDYAFDVRWKAEFERRWAVRVSKGLNRKFRITKYEAVR